MSHQMQYRNRVVVCVVLFLTLSFSGFSQRYLTDLDSSLFVRDSVRPLLKRLENLRFSGYIQSQFQSASAPGTKNFEGGDFSQYAKTRFMLRRARIRLDYLVPSKTNKWAKALFAFQVDATERGVLVRDMFLRLYETKYHNYAFTTGLFARPFGFEVNLASFFRESPERGRMSQILMPAERDLGVMGSFEPQDRHSPLGFLKIDAGLFNGQGLSGPTEFDSRKDFISRVAIKPLKLKQWEFSGGLSLLQGGWRQQTKYLYQSQTLSNNEKSFVVDSLVSNVGKIANREYYGADVQVEVKHGWGSTEIRGEYWTGRQPGIASSTSNPGVLPAEPTYIRYFSGGFIYLLQNIVNNKHQLIVKLDWYDPNKKVSGTEIGRNGNNFTVADIRYTTLGFGYTYYINDHLKLVLYQALVRNERTQLTGYTTDVPDNVFTCRIQFRF